MWVLVYGVDVVGVGEYVGVWGWIGWCVRLCVWNVVFYVDFGCVDGWDVVFVVCYVGKGDVFGCFGVEVCVFGWLNGWLGFFLIVDFCLDRNNRNKGI